MGFRKLDLGAIKDDVSKVLREINSPYNDGFTSSTCKQELYLLKCWLDDEYCKLPTFVGEESWEQQRLIEILKR